MTSKNVVPAQQFKDWFVLKMELKGGTKGKDGVMKNVVISIVYGKLGSLNSETIGATVPFEGGPEAPEKLHAVLRESAAGIDKLYTTNKVEGGKREIRETPLIPYSYTKVAMAGWLWEEAQKQWRERYSKVFPA